ncbi:DUF4241 domain-containing protein [Bacteroides sp. 519]|uniref:DUF4241 domain-containing protein n=1 Tax=Bacteroides sp. 519 TaxID=2302937 RepID=UPI0013D2214A|nr:DUF4241 domain-containing protein [Bacteroides sp. 519]NDV58871.1 DUF4241 domain-containing protein [Bacteroides sp. 519]
MFESNKQLIATYPFPIPESYSAKVPKSISKRFHEGCEIIRRGRIEEGLNVLVSEGEKYSPLTAYVLAQLVAYFERDWEKVMDLLVFAISNEPYYNLIKAFWIKEKLFDYLLVDIAAIKTNRIAEAERLLPILEQHNETKYSKSKILTPQEYFLSKKFFLDDNKEELLNIFEKAKTQDYYKQDYCSMAYSLVKFGETEKAVEAITGWSEYSTNFIDSKTVIVIPFDAMVLHEFYGIGDDAHMAKQFKIFQKARYVRLPEDGPADTRLPKSKPCNNHKGFKISGLLEAAFGDKQCVCEGWIFEKRTLGNIKIVSGKIILDDPLIISSQPLITTFPKGEFPVEIAIARKSGDQRVALAKLLFANNEVVSWDIALCEDIKPQKDHIYGYGVDTGTGCFADFEIYQEYETKLTEDISDYIVDEFDKNGNTGLVYENVAMFSTGFGDGFYQSYIGRDKENNITCIITDFQVIDWLNN